jgi:hypothetical protein
MQSANQHQSSIMRHQTNSPATSFDVANHRSIHRWLDSQAKSAAVKSDVREEHNSEPQEREREPIHAPCSKQDTGRGGGEHATTADIESSGMGHVQATSLYGARVQQRRVNAAPRVHNLCTAGAAASLRGVRTDTPPKTATQRGGRKGEREGSAEPRGQELLPAKKSTCARAAASLRARELRIFDRAVPFCVYPSWGVRRSRQGNSDSAHCGWQSWVSRRGSGQGIPPLRMFPSPPYTGGFLLNCANSLIRSNCCNPRWCSHPCRRDRLRRRRGRGSRRRARHK